MTFAASDGTSDFRKDLNAAVLFVFEDATVHGPADGHLRRSNLTPAPAIENAHHLIQKPNTII